MLIKLPILKSTNIKQTVIGILQDVPNKPTINGPIAKPVVTEEL